jgi:hypothetical protein
VFLVHLGTSPHRLDYAISHWKICKAVARGRVGRRARAEAGRAEARRAELPLGRMETEPAADSRMTISRE